MRAPDGPTDDTADAVPLTLVALACAVAGAVIVAGTGAGLEVDGMGVVFALASALTFSAYLIAVEHVVRRTSPLTSALWVSAGASAGLFVFAGITGRYIGPQGGADWWAILGMGVASAGAFVCLMAGLQRMGALRTAIVSATEPLSATFLAYVYLDESVSAGTALGGVLILAGRRGEPRPGDAAGAADPAAFGNPWAALGVSLTLPSVASFA